MSTAATARRLPTAPRATARAKPLPFDATPRLRLRASGASLVLQAGEVVDVRGFKGLLLGSFVVAYINPGSYGAGKATTNGITIRLRPVPAPKPTKAKGKKGSGAR